MDNKLGRAVLCGFAGIIVGMGMGVAAFGSAVNAAWVFGPLGFAIGWMAPWRNKPSVDDTPVAAPEGQPFTSQRSDFGQIEHSANSIASQAGRMLGSIWNLQMKFLAAVGAMPVLQKRPWIFFAASFLLLAFVFPIGVIFTLSGVAALHSNVSAEDQFIIRIKA